MTPIPLGILAVAGAASGPSDFQLISTQVLGTAASSVTFSSIPQTFRHLQIRIVAMGGSDDGVSVQGFMRFNGDTGANYSQHNLQHYSGYGVTSSGNGSTASINLAPIATNYISGNHFSPQIIDIVDYSQTTKAKTARIIGGFENGSKSVNLLSGNWRSAAAISSISIAKNGISQYAGNSRFSLYGWN